MTDEPTLAPPAPAPDLHRSIVALGVALLSTAVVLSAVYARSLGHLDGSFYAAGLLATLGLLGIAAAGIAGVVVPRSADRATDIVVWAGTAGAFAAGLMLAVGFVDEGPSLVYAIGLVVAGIAVAGYVLTRRGAFLAPAVWGSFAFAAMLFDDVIGATDDDGMLRVIAIAVALAVFAVLATAATWRLRGRVVGALVAGSLTTFAFAQLSWALPLVGYDMWDDSAAGVPSITAETWTILGLAFLLVLGWMWCGAVTGHLGFRILVVAMVLAVVPMALLALSPEHPTWWIVAVAGMGGAALLVVAVRSRQAAA